MPGIALGLFLARLGGEWVGLPGWWAAALLGLALAAAGAWLLARWPLRRTWPALVLLAYVVYPEVNMGLAGWLALVAVIAYVAQDSYPVSSPPPQVKKPVLRWPLIEAALFLAFLALYILTLAPDVLAADSGELQVVAAQLGVAHPPGFPLYVMLAHLFTRLPFDSPAYAVNLFSAVAAALTVAVTYRAGLVLTGRRLPALLGAAALGTATTFWSQATTANVRSLTVLFAALILLALLAFREATARGDERRADRWLVAAALFMGFGLTHHVSLAFLILVGLLFILVVDRGLWRQPRRWLPAVGVGLLGLLPLLYLPWRAAAGVRGASPDLATLPGFLEHVLATGFRGDLFYFTAPALLWERLRVMGNVMTFQFAPLLLAGMALGLLALLRRDRAAALLLGGAFAVYTLVAATYRAPQTVEYMMPAYVPAALCLAYAGAEARRLSGASRLGAVAGPLFAALMAVAVLPQGFDHVSASGARHEGTSARNYAAPLLANAPPDSVVLAHWHWATPLWYLQEVEGQRPDVDVRFVFPEGEPYDATWARRTAEAFAEGRPVITTWVPTAPPADLPVPEPIGEALLYPQTPRSALPPDFTPTQIALGGAVEVVGYRIEQPAGDPLAPGEELALTVAWRPLGELPAALSLFLHLAGPDGTLYGQADQAAVAAEGITLTQFRLTPRPGAPVGPLTLYIGATGEATGRERLADVAVGPSSGRPYTAHQTQRRLLEGGDTLIGYDWDHTLADRRRLYLHWRDAAGGYRTQVVDDDAVDGLALPPYRGSWGAPAARWDFSRGRDGGHYVPFGEGIVWTGETVNGVSAAAGETFTLDQEFHSARPINRDYVVSARLIGLEPDGFHWAWWDLQDSVPALGAIPTLKWVAGSFVRSPHRVAVSPDAPPGQTLTGALTLYDAFTNRPLPILDERITADYAWVPLCQGQVK